MSEITFPTSTANWGKALKVIAVYDANAPVDDDEPTVHGSFEFVRGQDGEDVIVFTPSAVRPPNGHSTDTTGHHEQT